MRRLLLSLLVLGVAAPSAFSDSPLAGHLIVLDAGHGTIDYRGHVINSGKISRNGKLVENRLTFDIVQKIGKRIEEAGGRVIYTRTPTDYWRQASSVTEDNRARAILANELKAEAFIAIHCDWDPRTKIHGITTFYKSPASQRLGESVHRRLIKDLKAQDRKLTRDSYTVLDQTTMPSILVETGFLSNRNEGKKLSTDEYQTKIAQAITAGLSSYFSN